LRADTAYKYISKRWHFAEKNSWSILDDSVVPLTAFGRVTEKLLQLNLGSRIEVRERLIAIKEYQREPE
jgi:hypothetical protein